MDNMQDRWRFGMEAANSFSASNGLYMLFWLFLLGSVAGFFLEGAWSVVRWGRWSHHAGVVWGPFCTVYGLGAAAMYVAVSLLPDGSLSRWKLLLGQFIVCALAGSLVEYFVSLFQQIGFGSVSWDYSGQKYNIGGRVSAGMTIVWGAVGLVFMQIVCPTMCALIERIQGRSGYIATWALIAFMCVNLAVSGAAVNRWRERGEGIPPKTSIGAVIDERFDDARMEYLFPNMQFCKPGSYSYADHAA